MTNFSGRGQNRTILSLTLAVSSLACKPPPAVDDAGSETAGDGDGDPTGDGDGDPTGDGDGDPTGDGDGDPTGDGDGDPTGDGDGDPSGCAGALDILLVVDNSGTMGEAQARLAASMAGLIDPLDAAGVDWRIGVTTTDNGNPWCPPGQTTPEAGNLVLSSCKSRLGDFNFNNGQIDASDLACNDVCEFANVAIAPTTTEVDDTPAPRRWVERIDGVSNLADDLDPAAALACLVPMGINGCGFEQQLESGYLALVRAQNADEMNYGFLRSDASLLVIIVSDEVDCSYNKGWSEIFEPDGNKVFWSDPNSQFPTSAVCWNAGVECVGDPSSYASCDPADFDVNAESAASDADAVLHPVGRYDALLDGLEAQLQALDPTAAVQLSVIGGAAGDGTLVYAASPDSNFQNSFGIGPGCSAGDMEALPPVRMREVVEHSGGQLQSICADSYAGTLGKLVEPFTACP
ncbi:hypothetical protein [Enhygromyxa salina]|uniref:Uncharacterized protein n=1 Tax=Enhygromyxa salina TaxID=215803 RepID=A0A2S9YQF4_9BACT|nr:hypothetical protein [Enhygromyxa salina]PRQ07310.1 hypothetical protein ENSA7_30200 [Enhygromyxa salina]